MELHWVRLKLYQWGRMNKARGIGYPSMCATEKARVGRGGVYRERELPPDLEDVDEAVRSSPPQHKLIIVECYTKDGDYRDHAARLRLSVDAWYRRKNSAERAVFSLLRTANG